MKTVIIFISFLVWIATSQISSASNPEPAGAVGDVKGKPEEVQPLKLSATLSQDGARDIYDQVTIFVDLENPTDKALPIQRVYLLMGDAVVLTRPLQQYDEKAAYQAPADQQGVPPSPYNWPMDGQWSGPEGSEEIQLAPKGRQSLTLIIPSADFRAGVQDGNRSGEGGLVRYLSTLLSRQYLLTFTPMEHNVHVVADYSDGGSRYFSQRTTVKVRFTATWGAIMLGGLLGVMMLFVLRITVALVDESIKLLQPGATFTFAEFKAILAAMGRRAAAVGLTEFIAALVWLPSVIVICVLLMRMEPGSFPITFQVNDFIGGVMLGLFTRSLVEPLIRKLFPVQASYDQHGKPVPAT